MNRLYARRARIPGMVKVEPKIIISCPNPQCSEEKTYSVRRLLETPSFQYVCGRCGTEETITVAERPVLVAELNRLVAGKVQLEKGFLQRVMRG